MSRHAWWAVGVLWLGLGAGACRRASSTNGTGEGASASAPPLADFEGKIDVAVKQAAKGQGVADIPQITLFVKDERVRIDLPPGTDPSHTAPKGYGILDMPAKKLYFVADKPKLVISLDLDRAGEQFKDFAARQGLGSTKRDLPAKSPATVTKTGVTNQVAGYSCENWDVAAEKRKVATLCVSDQSASWFHLPITGIPTEYAWSLELLDGKHFPFRVIGYGEDGAEEGRVEVTKVEKRPLAASLFQIPADYRMMDWTTVLATGMGAGSLFGGGLVPSAGLPPGFMPPATAPRPK